MQKKVYLAGPITGASDPHTWRNRVTSMLPRPWVAVDPTKFPLPQGTPDVVGFDLAQIRQCDAVIVLADNPSWGTAMEIFWAVQHHIPVIAIVPPSDQPQSPWLAAHTSEPVYTLREAVEVLDLPLARPLSRHPRANPESEQAVRTLIRHVGEDPDREGLAETPARVVRAWKEWATGYGQDPAAILKCFEDGAQGCDELVIVHNIPFVSKCEHHLADIIGHAHVGYIPGNRIVGLSKLARLVEVFARRLQVQERATVQIADALVQHLEPRGVGVLVRAAHACMSTRGVKIHGSVTTTSAMRGALMEKGDARKEFMDLCAMAEKDRIP